MTSNSLTKRLLTILIFLFNYRGMTALQLAAFFYNTKEFTFSNEKSMYQALNKLINLGYVKKYKPNPAQCVYSIYYLSEYALEYIKSILNIGIGQNGDGYLPFSKDTTFYDISYDLQRPPLKQLNHHLMLIDTFIEIAVARKNTFKHRNNIYASRSTASCTLRPDAEIFIEGKSIFVELDTGTESHDQLISKFENYAEYIKQKKKFDEEHGIDKILFVIQESEFKHGYTRRWNNVLAAFYKGMKDLAFEVDLVMSPISGVFNVLLIEKHSLTLTKQLFNSIENQYADSETQQLFDKKSQRPSFVKNISKKQLDFVTIMHKYDSTLFRVFYNYLISANKLKFNTNNSVLIGSVNKDICLNLNLEYYKVDERYTILLDKINDSMIEFINVNV